MPPPHPRAPPELPVELVEVVLLRVPPDDPASLVRAALVCRRWCGLVADPAFRRRRLELHGATPPMLGFMCCGWDGDSSFARFVPSSSFLPSRAEHRGRRAFDARHGRVLLHGREYKDFIVWNPITDQVVELPRPPDSLGNGSMKATVLCAAAATTGACDHLDCHRGPFIVVLVGTNDDFAEDSFEVEVDGEYVMRRWLTRVPKDMFACVYSSESGVWSEPSYAEHPDDEVDWARSALVGNALYFVLYTKYERILKYDLGTRKMSLIILPEFRPTDMTYVISSRIQLTTMDDGRLGFARVEKSGELRLWSRDDGNEVEPWTLCKVIDLKKLFPLFDSAFRCRLVGFAESVYIAFMALGNDLFAVDMKSGLKRKVSEGCCICCVAPYINFCTPALGAASRYHGLGVGTSSA